MINPEKILWMEYQVIQLPSVVLINKKQLRHTGEHGIPALPRDLSIDDGTLSLNDLINHFDILYRISA